MNINEDNTKSSFLVFIILALTTTIALAQALPRNKPVQSKINFSSPAVGGILCFSDANFVPEPAIIKTKPKENAESVAARLAEEINKVHPDWAAFSIGSTLIVEGSELLNVISGTESGLGLIPPPTSLNASFNNISGKLDLRWENGAEYDIVVVKCNVDRFIYKLNETSATIQLDPKRYTKGIGLTVQGFKDSSPSSVASLMLKDNFATESGGHLGFGGLQSNWTGADLPVNIEASIAVVSDFPKNNRLFKTIDSKPYYQMFNVKPSNTTSVIVRKIPRTSRSIKKLSMYVSRELDDAIQKGQAVFQVKSSDEHWSSNFRATNTSARSGTFRQYECVLTQDAQEVLLLKIELSPVTEPRQFAVDWLQLVS